ncbi:Rho1 guanine nucleotide exchange factor 1 [Leucoagaricus sp. SymC.cos]|nr:Rho1 guanine nucleotide exchange factor 1 [Leucoagaricus sp. SymC.cos]
METSVNKLTKRHSPRSSLNESFTGDLQDFDGSEEAEEAELLSPYSDNLNPAGHFSTDMSSRWPNQPATPSSVNTASRSLTTSYPPSPPPLPQPPPLPPIRSDATGSSTARRIPRPLPIPPSLPGPSASTPNHTPSPSSPCLAPAPVVPYVGVAAQRSPQAAPPKGLRRAFNTRPPASLPLSEEPRSPSVTENQVEVEDDEEIDLEDDDSEVARSDIDEGGEKMVPLPPYVQRVDPTLILEGGPPVEQALTRPLSDLPSPEGHRVAGRSAINSSESYYSESRSHDFHSSDPGPSNQEIYYGRNSYDASTRGDFEEMYESQHHNHTHDFESEDYHGAANLARRNSRLILVGRAPSDVPPLPRTTGPLREEGPISDPYEEEDEEDVENFINYSLLSHLATLLRDKVPRDTHIKGSIPYPNSFTGKDIVSTIHYQIVRELRDNHGGATHDRRPALLVARSLQSQLFFYEVEWGGRILQDGVGDVYMFLDESQEPGERAEIPTGVVTPLSKCYSPSCGEFENDYCYSYVCPRKGLKQLPSAKEALSGPQQDPWPMTVPEDILNSLTENEIDRQTIIHKLLSKEEQYVHDLDLVESVFIEPLRNSGISVNSGNLQEFIDEIFGNLTQVRDMNKRLLEILYVRQREQAPVVGEIGDIFLDAATTDFKEVYPVYIGHYPIAEKQLREELEKNPEFRLFVENCSRRQSTRLGQSPRLDLKHFLSRPVEHLQKYRVLLEAIYKETDRSNADGEFLTEAVKALNKLQTLSQVHAFQETVMRGSGRRWEWSDLVTPSERQYFSREEAKRQSIIFELIATEMDYVKDLHNINKIFITPLQEADPSIIPRDRLPQFLQEVFSNIQEITMYHQRLVEQLHHIQREYHPRIPSITAAVFDTALNFREAYLEYIPNYPIAAYRIEDEKEKNLQFKIFHDNAIRHPGAQRLEMKHFIHRPIPRLLRYELLLKGIVETSPPGHEDRNAIPNVIEILKSLGKDTEPGVSSAKQKVDLWKYNSSIVFKPGEHFDMDLLNDSRSLIHTGKLYRQPEGGMARNDWPELTVLLFDNYFVMTKVKVKDGVTEYHVTKRPIPLDLLTMVKFDDQPIQRPSSLRNRRNDRNPQSPTSPSHSRSDSGEFLYPFTVHHTGRLGGPCILYAESAAVRTEWQKKLEETLGLRRVVMESNKVFEIETLSQDTFLVPSMPGAQVIAPWGDSTVNGGKVTCSVPFTTHDGRKLVAIGCAEGVWIGFMHDPRSMRRVLHLRNVTQCAMLDDFGLFLVLAEKTLFAYHIEALVPTQPNSPLASVDPQRLNSHNNREVLFFTVGTIQNRTLVIYMRKRGSDSVFHALEPVADKIGERPKPTNGIGWPWNRSKTGWFRNYKEFMLPSECYDLIFLKARIAILCQKGFEIMAIENLSSVTIPITQDSRLTQRCESCRPLGMFRVNDDEFILCYNEFGLYVNKHGDPSRTNSTVEWEGTADRVALHAPYILLFDPRFIEVRHVDTGRLAQIIPGTDVRCVWDGRGADSSPAVVIADGSDDNMSQDPKIHTVMNSTSDPLFQQSGRPSRQASQHVFELVPTIPLYLPDPIASPPAAAHFQPSFSPPRSPPLRAAASYRS